MFIVENSSTSPFGDRKPDLIVVCICHNCLEQCAPNAFSVIGWQYIQRRYIRSFLHMIIGYFCKTPGLHGGVIAVAVGFSQNMTNTLLFVLRQHTLTVVNRIQ
jgi:hypothetical protein